MAVFVSNGDSLGNSLVLCQWHAYPVINCRECHVVGPVSLDIIEHFKGRENFLSNENEAQSYNEIVVKEFQKVKVFERTEAIYLWFENDLFCQVNYWFCIYLFSEWGYRNLYCVKPLGSDINPEINFGNHDNDMLGEAYNIASKLNADDITHGRNLWHAYVKNDIHSLTEFSEYKSKPFEHSKLSITLQMERIQDPNILYKKVGGLMNADNETFEQVFIQFQNKYPLYGFGDTQIYQLYQDIRKNRTNNYAS